MTHRMFFQGFAKFVEQDIDYRFLKRGGKVSLVMLHEVGVGFEVVAKRI